MTSKPRTLAQTLTRVLYVNLMAACLAAAAVMVLSMQGDPTPSVTTVDPDSPAGVIDRYTAGNVELAEGARCWTGEAPEGVEPRHAVVSLPGKGAEVVPAKVGLAIWLDGAPGTLHAFCR